MSKSIVLQKTYAETAAIFAMSTSAYNLAYAGTEIYVTDKGWHLLCYYDREAKPKSGILKINNGELPPAWLTPEILQIDTGSLTGDLSNETGTPVEIQAPPGYTPRYVYSAGTYLNEVVIYDMDDNPLFSAAPLSTGPLINGSFYIPPAYFDTHKLKIACDLSTDTYQAIIEYTKKPI